MTFETLILLVSGYVAMMVLVLCLLTGAKRSDEAVASYYEHGDDIAPERVQG